VHNVLTSIDVDSSAVLDGFTITGGNANDDDGWGNPNGGGIYIYQSNPTLANLIVSGNRAERGGGIYYGDTDAARLSPVLSNVVFSDNYADLGGGMANNNSSPRLLNVTFNDNSAKYGGGMANYFGSDPKLINVTFTGNSAEDNGGGIYNYEAGNPGMINVTFYGNSAAAYGGGIYNYLSNPSLTNVTFSGNSAFVGGGVYNTTASRPVIKDSVFWGDGAEFFIVDSSSAQINDSLIQGGCPAGATCTHVLTTNPLLGPLADNGGFTHTMALGTGSPAIDAGNNSTCAATDQRGVARPQGSACDLGAYEYVRPDMPYHIYLSLVEH
jgi:hypothetical protein